jgi:hypothetical protein
MDFDDCTAFAPLDYSPVAANGESVRTVTTCQHLDIGTYWDGTKHRYGCCRLGDVPARLAHLRTQIADSDAYVNWHADPDDLGLAPPPIMPPR